MSALISADLHFTDHPRDAHRWELLPWLAKQATKLHADSVFLLGDITDAKNNHSEALTNRLVSGLHALADVVPVYIIPGNHDGIDVARPYFRFLQGLHKDLHFMLEPTPVNLKGLGQCLFLPHTKDYEKDWEAFDFGKSSMVDYIFTHQTYDGCLTENGTRLDGIPPSVFKLFSGQVISGDIHKPQKLSRNLQYVGAPYRCRFGDDYKPRVLMIGRTKAGGHQQQDLHFPTKDKHLIKLFNCTLAEALRMANKWGLKDELFAGDQIKVRVQLPRAAMAEWPAIRQEIVDTAAKQELELTGPEAIVLPDDHNRATAQPKEGGLQPQTGPQGYLAAYAQAKAASAALKAAGEAMLATAIGDK